MSLPRDTTDQLFDDLPRIEEALQKAFESVVREHRMLNRPIITWENEKVVHVDPYSIVIAGDQPSIAPIPNPLAQITSAAT